VDNDILLCDMVGCCRAYHQKCLDPVVDTTLIQNDAYWFCWVCDTLANSLAWVNKKLGTKYERVNELFPELSSEASTWTGKFDANFYDPENVMAPIPVPEERRKRRKKSRSVEGEIIMKLYTL
jgi:hypothetical protein